MTPTDELNLQIKELQEEIRNDREQLRYATKENAVRYLNQQIRMKEHKLNKLKRDYRGNL